MQAKRCIACQNCAQNIGQHPRLNRVKAIPNFKLKTVVAWKRIVAAAGSA